MIALWLFVGLAAAASLAFMYGCAKYEGPSAKADAALAAATVGLTLDLALWDASPVGAALAGLVACSGIATLLALANGWVKP